MLQKGLSRRTVLNVPAGLIAVAGPRPARGKTRITVVTGGTGGVFYPYGGGIAKILSEKVPDMQATAQVTGGSVDNVKLLAAGEAELGFATLDSAWEGLNGLGAYANDGKQDIRTVALLYDSFFHVCAAADAQIGKVADFARIGRVGRILDRIDRRSRPEGRRTRSAGRCRARQSRHRRVGRTSRHRASPSSHSFRPAVNCRRSTRSSPASIDHSP